MEEWMDTGMDKLIAGVTDRWTNTTETTHSLTIWEHKKYKKSKDVQKTGENEQTEKQQMFKINLLHLVSK